MMSQRSLALPSLLGLALTLAMSAAAAPARGDLIFQSATTVLTGPVTTGVGGVETDSVFYSGVNFFVSTATTVSAIGGNFAGVTSGGNNQIFGAIVPVAGQNAPPVPPDLSSGVLGTTLITLNINRLDVLSGALNLTLAPGWYAEVFGSGRFGATSGLVVAATTLNGQPANSNGIVTYALRQPDGMQFLQAAGARYFVLGTTAIPEPSPAVLGLGLGLAALFAAARGLRRSA
jgi:hypothetical protein